MGQAVKKASGRLCALYAQRLDLPATLYRPGGRFFRNNGLLYATMGVAGAKIKGPPPHVRGCIPRRLWRLQSLTTSQVSSGLKRSMYLTIAVVGPRSVS